MEKKEISAKWFMLVAVVAIIAIVIVGNNVKQNNIKKEISQEYSTLMDEKLDEFLASTKPSYFEFAPSDYDRELGLTNINYEISRIKKEDDRYILYLDIYLTCDSENTENENALLAHDVKYEFEDFLWDVDDEICGYECSYCSYKSLDYYNENMITVYINNEKVLYPQQHDTDKYKDTTKCEVCGKRYNDGSENASSIARTNMCTSCYKDFKATKDAIDALDELPVD